MACGGSSQPPTPGAPHPPHTPPFMAPGWTQQQQQQHALYAAAMAAGGMGMNMGMGLGVGMGVGMGAQWGAGGPNNAMAALAGGARKQSSSSPQPNATSPLL